MKIRALLAKLWTRKTPSLADDPAYRATLDAEAEALKRGDTRGGHAARKSRQALILSAIRAVAEKHKAAQAQMDAAMRGETA